MPSCTTRPESRCACMQVLPNTAGGQGAGQSQGAPGEAVLLAGPEAKRVQGVMCKHQRGASQGDCRALSHEYLLLLCSEHVNFGRALMPILPASQQSVIHSRHGALMKPVLHSSGLRQRQVAS